MHFEKDTVWHELWIRDDNSSYFFENISLGIVVNSDLHSLIIGYCIYIPTYGMDGFRWATQLVPQWIYCKRECAISAEGAMNYWNSLVCMLCLYQESWYYNSHVMVLIGLSEWSRTIDFWQTFHGNFIYSRSFRQMLIGSHWRNIFFIYRFVENVCLVCGLNRDLKSK